LIISGDNQNQKEFAENVRKICDFIDLYFENEESFKEKVLEITKQKIDEYSLEKLIEARVRIQNLEEENQIKEKELSELREQLRVLQENSQLETKIERLNK
jgi:mevalonate kinase